MIVVVIGYILSFLLFCWLMYLAYVTVKESKEERTKQHVKIISLFFIILFLSNTAISYNYSRSGNLEAKMELHENFMLEFIEMTSIKLANNLESFVDIVDKPGDKTDIREIYPVWNQILEEAASMKEYASFFLFPEYLHLLEDEIRDLKQIISLTVSSLFSLNEQIHLAQNNELAAEEREKVKAIRDIYRAISIDIRKSYYDEESGLAVSKELIDSLQEPMEIVNPNFTRISMK